MTGSDIDLYPGLLRSMLTAVHVAMPRILSNTLSNVSATILQKISARKSRSRAGIKGAGRGVGMFVKGRLELAILPCSLHRHVLW
jgi:hypothetical protein